MKKNKEIANLQTQMKLKHPRTKTFSMLLKNILYIFLQSDAKKNYTILEFFFSINIDVVHATKIKDQVNTKYFLQCQHVVEGNCSTLISALDQTVAYAVSASGKKTSK